MCERRETSHESQATPDKRGRFGVGLGPHLAIDRRDGANAEEGQHLAGMLSLSARYRVGQHWHVQATWNRVITDDDRDSDMLLVGGGYKF